MSKCPECQYDLKDLSVLNDDGRPVCCPECGLLDPVLEAEWAQHFLDVRRLRCARVGVCLCVAIPVLWLLYEVNYLSQLRRGFYPHLTVMLLASMSLLIGVGTAFQAARITWNRFPYSQGLGIVLGGFLFLLMLAVLRHAVGYI